MIQDNFGVVRETTGKPVLKSIPIPMLEDDYILVETIAIALNPTDWTTIDAKGNDGTLVGCDYAGIVREVGKDVTKFKVGDRVAGFGHGGNDLKPWTGAFAKFIVAKGDIQLHIPANVTFEAAATLPVALLTAGYSLHKVLKLPYQDSNESVLIYGGSTASGGIAIQLAKLAGCKVYTTCSPKHFGLMKERGADVVYDYRSITGEEIRRDTENGLSLVLDCIAIKSSESICSAAIGPNGGIYCNLLGIDSSRSDVKSEFFLGYSVSGEEYIFERDHYPAQPEDFLFARQWSSHAERLWSEGMLKTHPDTIREGGLQGAIAGMNEMREGRGPSGEKWVYRVADTIWK